jgi:hypothetical protein
MTLLAVIGTIETTVADLIDGMYDSLKSMDDIPKEDSEKGTEAIRNKFNSKMGSISAKLEVCLFLFCLFSNPSTGFLFIITEFFSRICF